MGYAVTVSLLPRPGSNSSERQPASTVLEEVEGAELKPEQQSLPPSPLPIVDIGEVTCVHSLSISLPKALYIDSDFAFLRGVWIERKDIWYC